MSKEKKITIRTIAELCGVSVSTVSLVINNKAGVRGEVRELVKRCVEDLGWYSNNIQSHFSSEKQKRRIAFVFNAWQPSGHGGDPLALTLQRSLHLFQDVGILPMVFYGRCHDVLQSLLQNPLDVVIFLSNDFYLEPELRKLQNAGTRILLAHCEWYEPICPQIHSDHYSAGKNAAQKLKAHGCTSPAFYGGFGNRFHIRNLEEAGTPLNAYFSGIQTIFPQFDFQCDTVGEACRDFTEVKRMYCSGKYDGWIIQSRSFFDSFSFLEEQVGTEGKQEISKVIFDTVITPAYPVSKYDCFAEDCNQIASLIYELAMAVEEPRPQEYLVPYQWLPPWKLQD